MRRNTPGTFLLFLAVFALFPATAPAQEAAPAQEKQVHEIPPLVVESGPLVPSDPATPVVSVIDPAGEIPAGQVNDVTDLLMTSDSIFVEDSSYGKKVFLRNLGDQDYRVLIDGVPFGQMGTYYSRGFIWEIVPLDSIERIEVIRGAGSAEHGNTLVGTINIVTRRGTEEVSGLVGGSLGSFLDVKGGASAAGSHDALDWALGGSYRHRDPYLDNNYVQQYDAFAHMGLDLKAWGDLSVFGYHTDRTEGFVLDPRVLWNVWSEANGLSPNSDWDLQGQGVVLSWTSDWVDASFCYNGQDRDDNYLKYLGHPWAKGDFQDYTLFFNTPTAKLKVHHQWGNHAWKAGMEYTYGDASSRWTYYEAGVEDVTFMQDLWAAFVEDSWQLHPRVNLSVGFRYDHSDNRFHSAYYGTANSTEYSVQGDGWSPRATLTWNIVDALEVYGHFGRLYKAPTLADLYRWYGSMSLVSGPGRAVLRAFYGINQPPMAPASLIPQPYIDNWRAMIGQLRPATGYDGELGVRQHGERYAYGVNLFYEYIDDYIVLFPSSYPPTYNVDNVQLWGLEVDGSYTFCKWLEIEGNYAFIQNHVRGDELVQGLYDGREELFNAPENVLNVFVRSRPFEGFLAEWQVNFVSGRFAGGEPGAPPQAAARNPSYQPITDLGPYDLHNLQMTYEPGAWKGMSPRLSFAVQNIFDRRDYMRLDYPLPGRLFYGGLELAF